MEVSRVLASALIVVSLAWASVGGVTRGGTLRAATDVSPTLDRPAPAVAKQPMHGLVSMGDIGFFTNPSKQPQNALADLYARPGAFDGVVVNVAWKQLEPSPGRIVTAAIDDALAGVRAYNAANPARPLGVRLAVFAGFEAPEWAKEIGGSPISLYRRVGDPVLGRRIVITVGRFWTAPYGQAWASLQRALAAKYDADPAIREITVASCASINGEPFLDGSDSPETRANLQAAGFSDAAFRNCLKGSFGDYAQWKNTFINYPFNPFFATDSGRRVPDAEFAVEVMRAWRRTYGRRAVLSNYGLDGETKTGAIGEIYGRLRGLGSILEFQLQAPSNDYDKAIAFGVSLGATAIEVWDTACRDCAFVRYDGPTLANWSSKIRSNPLPP